MSIWQGRSRRSRSGGRLRRFRSKKKHELGGLHREARIGGRELIRTRARGGGRKIALAKAEHANVVDREKKTWRKVKIISVTENPANPHYVRRNIITRGAIIETELGKAKVLSRPGQEGNINAVLI